MRSTQQQPQMPKPPPAYGRPNNVAAGSGIGHLGQIGAGRFALFFPFDPKKSASRGRGATTTHSTGAFGFGAGGQDGVFGIFSATFGLGLAMAAGLVNG